ncbi:SpvB/TcaC N-terminal domain-containing protein [Kribbella sp. NPDC004536]|uniref:SpvB/TcaC N-terminal domain-containing protein n=1 Tax=Kribbella sp. NPDC004536 TaxID=3364106 RepID=UPI0036AFF0AC
MGGLKRSVLPRGGRRATDIRAAGLLKLSGRLRVVAGCLAFALVASLARTVPGVAIGAPAFRLAGTVLSAAAPGAGAGSTSTAGSVTPPEGPEGVSFDPNQLKGITAGTPTAGVDVASAVGGSSSGDANVSFSVDVPSGRAGMQPSVGVGYSSSGGDSWTGMGWSVASPMISVDTRWGVPRYDAATETESYLLNGVELTPVANRGPAVPRVAERVFHTRVEGGFAKIVRHGTDPKNYSWEVVDKSGTHSFYGGTGATLADDTGDIAEWGLREIRDVHDNLMRYHYALVTDPGVDGGTVMGRNLYVQRITWTGRGDVEGKYAVSFVRDRDLGEGLRGDKSIDARAGFKRVTADLLRHIDVTFNNALVRRYVLNYRTGAFGKTLLASLEQHDAADALVGKHDFDYYDDIRDAAGTYHGFESAGWNVPSDGLDDAALNVGGALGGASMLGSNASAGKDRHSYEGWNPDLPVKPGSVGVKTGSSSSSSVGVLALMDVDGDNLPDKVFRDEHGQVKYRKNLARPGGVLAFSDSAVLLDLPGGFGHESSRSSTVGVEGFPGIGPVGVSAQLDWVRSTSSTDRYFADVNADGITDVVAGGDVWFGRLGAGGVPVYGLNNSAATPAPVTAGRLDTAKLPGVDPAEQARLDTSFPLLDTVRRWVAPFDGHVQVTGAVKLDPTTAVARAASAVADGVRVAIQDETDEVWSDVIGKDDTTDHVPARGVSDITVKRGDRLYFRVGSRNDGSLDAVAWDPVVTYLGDGGSRDVNGLPEYRFDAARDFTLAGRSGPGVQVKAPLTGTLHLAGDFTKTLATSDDVAVQVFRDGTAVLDQAVAGTATGTVPVNLDISVIKGQVLTWRIKADSPVDLQAFGWTPHAYYTAVASGQGVDRVTDGAGNPVIVMDPVVDADMYPIDDLSGAQPGVVVPSVGGGAVQVGVTPGLVVTPGQTTPPSGTVVFTVKRISAGGAGGVGELAGKGSFTIINGQVRSEPGTITVTANGGDTLFYDYSLGGEDTAAVAALSPLITSHVVTDTLGGPNAPRPSALHVKALDNAAFAQPYRGWGVIGYNAHGDRAESAINEGDLAITSDWVDQLPDSVDPDGQADDFSHDPQVTPPPAVPFTAALKDHRWQAGNDSWATADGASSSRLGATSLDDAGSSGVSATDIAIPRKAKSDGLSKTGGVEAGASVALSVSSGNSPNLTDFLDMNGDGFPDVVTPNGIQYTDPTGGLGTTELDATAPGGLPDGTARSSRNTARTLSPGAPSVTIVNGRDKAAPDGHSSANTSQAGDGMIALGLGGSFGQTTADARFDLIDVNGDSLPDRVYGTSQTVDPGLRGKVALNLGYRFADPETWPGAGQVNAGNGEDDGLNLGFNTDFYGFAGGASLSWGTTFTKATLADLNGDGLADRVLQASHAGDPIQVAFNTGTSFADPVPFTGALNGEIARDTNATFGHGAYFTLGFGIPFVGGFAVFNPGQENTDGRSRSEQALRDINGDGLVDHLSSTSDGQLTVAQNTTGRTNLLKQVTLPLGQGSSRATTAFDYSRDGNTADQPQSKWVLSKLTSTDGHPGDGAEISETTYTYSGGVYDRKEREFRGYAQVAASQHNTVATGDPVYRSTTTSYRTDSYYTKGLPVSMVTVDASGHKFTQTDTAYTVRDINNANGTADLNSTTATLFPFASRSDQSFFEGQTSAGKATYSTADYDSNGNEISSLAAGEPGTADDVTSTTAYTTCPTTGITEASDAKTVVGGIVKRHTHSDVDCATGEITETRSYLLDARGVDGAAATTDATYYPDTDPLRGGNLKTVTDPANKIGQRATTTYDYDTVVGNYPETVTDQFGYVSTSTHDYRFGVELTSTDINHQTIRNTYDSLGRLTSTTAPQEAAAGRTTIAFEYHPEAVIPYAVARHADRQADGSYKPDTMDTITFTDGLGRTVQTKADATVSTTPGTAPTDVMTVSGHTTYDAFGRATTIAFPVTEPKGAANTSFNATIDSVQPTVTTFDVMDRAVRTTLSDGTSTTVAHGFGTDRGGVTQFETVTTDPNGKTARTYSDVKSETTAVKQFNPAGGTSQAVIWTSFGYDPLGEKTSITDNAGHVTSTVYDALGRSTAVISPDSGETDTAYDLAGNAVTKHTANMAVGQVVNYDYDYTRLKAVRYPVFTANNVTYTYGAPGAARNTAGRIVHIVDAAGTQDFEYGALGETTKDTRMVTNHGSFPGSFTTSYTYDSFNRVLKLSYPDAEILTYHYNSGGQVDSATGTKTGHTYPYLTRLDYDKFGLPLLQATGNGTTTTWTRNPVTRRVDNLKSSLSAAHGNYTFQNLNYAYDPAGNITKLSNAITLPPGPQVGVQVGGPSTENYRYDDLYRLVHADGTYTPQANKTDAYTLDTTYNALSDIINKNQTRTITSPTSRTTDGALSYNNGYTYGASARPHEATKIGLYTFQYDSNGNEISRAIQSGPRRQLIWDEDNRLACSHENTQATTMRQAPTSCDNAGGTTSSRYLYNPSGGRVEKIDANVHIYPNQNYSTVDGKAFKHIYINGSKLLTQQVEPDQQLEDLQYWDHPDHQGSTNYVTDDSGAIAEHLNYFPGGETWNDEHPSQPVPAQYTGKELDPQTGYYYYGARYYDPRFSNWTATDSALPRRASTSQSLATYSYADANPISNTDPDGNEPLPGWAAASIGGPTTPGTATITWTGVHASIETSVQVNGEVRTVRTDLLPKNINGEKLTVIRNKIYADQLTPGGQRFTVDLPDGLAAQQLQLDNINTIGDPYKLNTNSCLTHCGDVLGKGRVEGVPKETWPLLQWLREGGGGARLTEGVAIAGVPEAETLTRTGSSALRCSVGLCGGSPVPRGYGAVMKGGSAVGTAAGLLGIFLGVKADVNYETASPEEKRELDKHKTQQVWPFPGLILPPRGCANPDYMSGGCFDMDPA